MTVGQFTLRTSKTFLCTDVVMIFPLNSIYVPHFRLDLCVCVSKTQNPVKFKLFLMWSHSVHVLASISITLFQTTSQTCLKYFYLFQSFTLSCPHPCHSLILPHPCYEIANKIKQASWQHN